MKAFYPVALPDGSLLDAKWSRRLAVEFDKFFRIIRNWPLEATFHPIFFPP
jgi:hypothetical protein